MEYLLALLILSSALEYYRRERVHKRALALLRSHRPPKPPSAASFRTVILQCLASLFVLGVALMLLSGTWALTKEDLFSQVLGAGLLPVATMLALMAARDIRAGYGVRKQP